MDDFKIISTLEEFNIPVGNKRIYENELEGGYNYFILRHGKLVDNGCGKFSRQIIVAYVYEGEQTISDYEIINKLKALNLNFISMDSDDFQIANTNNWVDMNTFIFSRPERG